VVDLVVPLADLAWRNPKTHGWEIESGTYRVMVGGSSTHLISAACEI
jgi:Fibronectin type III-like domain